MTFLSLFATVLTITVTDPSGAPMAVSGHIDNLASSVSTRVRTDAKGQASLDLLVGRYRLSLAHPGFARQVQVLDLSGPLSKTVTMTVGASSYSVDVVSPTPLPGLDRSRDNIPAPLQTATDRDFTASGALDLPAFANRPVRVKNFETLGEII